MKVQHQVTLEKETVLELRIRESLSIIENAVKKSALVPLIINFSGGKDSLTMLDLVQKVTDNFICCYMTTGIDFPEAKQFAIDSCRRFKRKLLVSFPSEHKGDFFQRLAQFRKFPTIKATWCSRDLKFRPQKKMLTRLYGKLRFFKLNGVRRFESSRRRKMHISTPRQGFMLPDYDVSKDIMVFPILNWSNEDVKQYLELNKIRVPTNPLYEKYGVSGCYWCPFYQPSIYRRIMKQHLSLYDRFIEWETLLNAPSVSGYHWLSKIKQEIMNGCAPKLLEV